MLLTSHNKIFRINVLALILLSAVLGFSDAGIPIHLLYDKTPANPPDTTPDTTLLYPIPEKNSPYDIVPSSKLYLNEPSNIKQNVEYDPITNEYVITNKIGELNYMNPASLDFKEYQEWDMRRAVNRYWIDKSRSNSAAGGSGIIPKLRVGGEAFEKVFGGNTIEVRPQGSAELIFSIVSNKRNDPAINQRLRRTTNFDFDMNIQMNVMAKIGDKIEFNANQNTEATFDFENKLKLKYEGKEDEIIKLIEAGNVNLPLNSTLITGSQSLFGIKTQLQFGKAIVTSVFSSQESQAENITVQGGAQTTKFDLSALDYEENKHFFLAQYFYDNYDDAMKELPVIGSNIVIRNLEVWVTNVGYNLTENRNIVAFQDLGETDPYNQHILPATTNPYPNNGSNSLLYEIDTAQIRDIKTVSEYLTQQKGYVPGIDFEKVENARLLNKTEYSFNSQLGFISLNTTLNPDQTLAVAFDYQIIGSNDTATYSVGELANTGVKSNRCLVLKLLRSTSVNTSLPMWKLMMKNVYNLNSFNINREDFILNILYSGNSNAVPTGYFTDGPENIKGIPLIKLFGFDRLDPQQNPPGDGIFDFLDGATTHGGTINSSNGRIFFPVVEPFGSYLRNLIKDKTYADRYCFDSLYTLTKTGAQQYPQKNKFAIEGQYKSESSSEISLNAMNVPQGSVKVTAGGQELVENQHYTVDYTLGRVKIIDEGILNSGTPINISLESNSLFSVYKQTMVGSHVDYKVNNNLLLGGTIMNLYERPITQKTNYGDEPISNTIWGASVNYSKESGFITKMVDKLPFINTAAVSKLRFDAEFAQFIPGHSKAVGKAGTSYIDDFEGAKSTISLNQPSYWFLASTPQGQNITGMFPEAAPGTGIAYGFNRAKLAWYLIDNSVFYSSKGSRPDGITANELSRNSTRIIPEKELFPNAQSELTQPTYLYTMNLAYFPAERGPYNFDVDRGAYSAGLNSDGSLADPESRWGGIMRRVETTDFEAANIEYITFWLMDPFTEDSELKGGDLYFNLGDISEDILRDGRKSFENGLPTTADVKDVDTTIWGRVPNLQMLTDGFDNKDESRPFQDIGYDGLNDTDERMFRAADYVDKILNKYGEASDAYKQANSDPSADNYHHYTGDDYDADELIKGSITQRYKLYNGVEGNSPANNDKQIGYRYPNMEDINKDNTLSEQERYFQYVVHITPEGLRTIGENYIVDSTRSSSVKLENDKTIVGPVWYQFKIPIQHADKVVGKIQDFRSIRFMRMFVKGFNRPVVLRFANLELERGDWRKYYNSLLAPGEYIPDPNQNATTFDLSSVSYEENSKRSPVNYCIPPGIDLERNMTTTKMQLLNEQAMVIKTCNLVDGDARAAYKTTDFDFRDYKNLQMFIHAESSIENANINTGDLTVFVRFGSDFTENYYEYEVPLTFTPWDTPASFEEAIWPIDNNLNVELDKLVALKQARNTYIDKAGSSFTISMPYSQADGKNKMTIVGLPSISDVRTIMIGIRNPKKNPNLPLNDDGMPKCAEIWVNELRLTNFNEKAGWAANARLSTNLADLGNMVIAGSYSSPHFASLEKKITERQKEAVAQFDFATNLELGKFFPEKSGIRIPMHYDYSQTLATPEYDPLNPDILLADELRPLNAAQRDSVRKITNDVTTRQNLNFMNVRKDRVAAKGQPKLWDVENFDLSYAYSELKEHDIDVESSRKKTHRGGLGYNFAINSKNVKPFQNLIKSKSLSLIKDFNFYYLPKMLSFRTDMYREYQSRLLRNKSEALIILEPSVTKVWDWNRIYDLRYDVTQSLKLDYNANVNAFVLEPPGAFDKNNDNYQDYRDSVKTSIMNFGSIRRFNQSANINYQIPFSKIGLLNWLSANVRYGAIYRWEASATSLQPRFGNTIENTANFQINGNARLSALYNKVGFLKKVSQELQSQGKPTPPKPGQVKKDDKKDDKSDDAKGKKGNVADDNGVPFDNPSDTAQKEKKNYLKLFAYQFTGILMSVKEVNFAYNRSDGTLLPGFMPQPGVLGNSWKNNAPGLGFIFGSQADIAKLSGQNNWLSTDPQMNSLHSTRKTETLNFRATLEPIKAMKIEVNGDKNFSSSYQDYYKPDVDNGNVFKAYNKTESGSFTSSYMLIGTTFSSDYGDHISPVFERMLENRKVIAERLAYNNRNSSGINDTTGFPAGYGPTQSEVLMGAFITAYTGSDPATKNLSPFPRIPIPNWRLTYNATQGSKFFKEHFQSFNILHAYRSSYTVSGFQNNDKYEESGGFPSALDAAGNFIPYNYIGVISMTEQFGPFIGVDITMKNSFMARLEYKKSRNLSLSFVTKQLTEIKSNEFVLGTGYRFKSVKVNIVGANGKRKPLNSDLNVKLDVSLRDNKTVLRIVEGNYNRVTAGALLLTINASADYMVSQKLNVRFYFDKTVNNPAMDSQIATSQTSGGISLRFTLTQ